MGFNKAQMGEEDWRKKLWKDGRAISVICEEATTYEAVLGDNAQELLTPFYKLGLTKSRKQEMPLTIVAHNNTQKILGVEGLGQTIEKLLQIELIATRDPITKKGKASGEARLRLGETNDWETVYVPHISTKITKFEAGEKEPEQEPNSADTPDPEKFPSSSDLQAMYDSKALPGLTPLQSDILRFLKEKGRQTSRQLQQNGYPSIKKSKSAEIKSALDGLIIGEMISLNGTFYTAL